MRSLVIRFFTWLHAWIMSKPFFCIHEWEKRTVNHYAEGIDQNTVENSIPTGRVHYYTCSNCLTCRKHKE